MAVRTIDLASSSPEPDSPLARPMSVNVASTSSASAKGKQVPSAPRHPSPNARAMFQNGSIVVLSDSDEGESDEGYEIWSNDRAGPSSTGRLSAKAKGKQRAVDDFGPQGATRVASVASNRNGPSLAAPKETTSSVPPKPLFRPSPSLSPEPDDELSFTEPDRTAETAFQERPEQFGTPMDIDDEEIQEIPAPVVAPPEPPSPEAIIDAAIAQILEIIPDVEPAHLKKLCEQYFGEYHGELHQAVLHTLFENPNYPKVELRKRKRSLDDEGDSKAKEVKIDYGSSERPFAGGPDYINAAVDLLQTSFGLIPTAHIRQTLNIKRFYAPAYLQLKEESGRQNPPYKRMVNARKGAKGKGRVLFDEEIEKEKGWLEAKLEEEMEAADRKLAQEQQRQALEESGQGIECGCCFGDYSFENMVQCPEAHLFCMDCARRTAEEAIGNRKVELLCMDQSGCKAAFPFSEVQRFLPEKNFILWERIKAEKSLEQAGIDGLESCPFCPYSVVIENEEEKLFRCENEDCMAVSCRKCKKLDHLPKSCKEMEEDRGLDARHVIEEAMTAALTRRCPKCNNPFVKTDGCNKMTCPSCRTLSCYLCRESINGYDHFDSSRGTKRNGGKCRLWDAIEQRGHDEVAAAARAALAKYKAEHPEAADTDIDIEKILPANPKGAGTGAAAVAGPGPAGAAVAMPAFQIQAIVAPVAAPRVGIDQLRRRQRAGRLGAGPAVNFGNMFGQAPPAAAPVQFPWAPPGAPAPVQPAPVAPQIQPFNFGAMGQPVGGLVGPMVNANAGVHPIHHWQLGPHGVLPPAGGPHHPPPLAAQGVGPNAVAFNPFLNALNPGLPAQNGAGHAPQLGGMVFHPGLPPAAPAPAPPLLRAQQPPGNVETRAAQRARRRAEVERVLVEAQQAQAAAQRAAINVQAMARAEANAAREAVRANGRGRGSGIRMEDLEDAIARTARAARNQNRAGAGAVAGMFSSSSLAHLS
ncbi:hypothetical protein DL93DRAFT_2122285 [Clavulina sp. PMI_390]|nr:hypothetical protein DL93DRAFT_2122285 [Clavulina sp. PMI_390]